MSDARMLQSAYALLQAGKVDEAEVAVQAVLEDAPKNPKAHQLLALIARSKGDLNVAKTALETALAHAPEDAEILNSYGNILSLQGHNVEAIKAYESSLKIAPNYANAAQNLGETLLMRQSPSRAANVFGRALEQHQGHLGLTKGLMLSLSGAHRYDEALQILSKLPPRPELAKVSGDIFASTQNFTQARAAYAMGMGFGPDAAGSFAALVQLSWLHDGEAGAKKVIEDILRQNSEAAPAYIQAAKAYQQIGNMDAANDVLRKCEEKFGAHPEIDHARAEILIEQGQGEPAFTLMQKALAAKAGDPAMMGNFALSAIMAGQPKAALDAAMASQQRYPKDQFWIAIEATAKRVLGQPYSDIYDYDRLVQVYDIDAPPEYDTMLDFNTALAAALDKTHETKYHPLGQSPRGGTQSTTDLRFVADPHIQNFFQAISTPIHAYMKHIGSAQGHLLTARNTGKYALSGAWSVDLKKGGHHVNHVHPKGWISSAYYVQVPDGIETDLDKSGWIGFGEPPIKGVDLPPERLIAPKAGRLVLFPSYLWHGTRPIKTDERRLTPAV